MMEKCPDIMVLEEALLLTEDDPTRLHVQQCGKCQALLSSLKAFTLDEPLPGDEDVPGLQTENMDQVKKKLAGFLEMTLGNRSSETVVSIEPRKSRFIPQAWMGMAAALVAVIGLWTALPTLRDMGQNQPVLRGEETIQTAKLEMVSASRDKDGSLMLVWQPLAGATSYVMVFWNDEFEEFSRLDPVIETTLKISQDSLPDPQKSAYFSILAMGGKQRELARSALMEIPEL